MYENLVVIFITDRYFTCQCIRKNNKFLALTDETPVGLTGKSLDLFMLTGTLPVSVIKISKKIEIFKTDRKNTCRSQTKPK